MNDLSARGASGEMILVCFQNLSWISRLEYGLDTLTSNPYRGLDLLSYFDPRRIDNSLGINVSAVKVCLNSVLTMS